MLFGDDCKYSLRNFSLKRLFFLVLMIDVSDEGTMGIVEGGLLASVHS
jgi:hypothetical protein